MKSFSVVFASAVIVSWLAAASRAQVAASGEQVYRTRCAGIARDRIARGDLRMTSLLADLAVRELGHDALAPYDDGALFENVNTPHDYARARAVVELNEKPPEDRITE